MIDRINNYIKYSSNKRIIENIFSLGGLKGATMLLPIIIIPHLIKSIGLELVGLLALAVSITAYLQTLINYGFAYTATREISRNNLDKNKNTATFYNVIYCQLILIALSFFILIFLRLFIPFINDNFLLLLLSLAHVSIVSISPSWFFQGVEDMKKIAGGEITGKIFSFLMILIFVKKPNDVLLVPLLYLIGQVLSLYIYGLFIKKYIYISNPPKFIFETIKRRLVDGWSMFINILMPNFYNNYSYLAIGYFSNLSAVAAYDIVRRIMNISEQTIGIISKVYYPVLSSNFHRFNKFLKVIFSIALIVFLMQIIFSFIGAMFLANTSLNIDTRLLYIQSFAPLILAFELAYGINFLGVNNQDRLLKNITILSSVIGFILVSVLTFKFAALGALIGVLLTILIKAIISYKMSNKYSIMVNR